MKSIKCGGRFVNQARFESTDGLFLEAICQKDFDTEIQVDFDNPDFE